MKGSPDLPGSIADAFTFFIIKDKPSGCPDILKKRSLSSILYAPYVRSKARLEPVTFKLSTSAGDSRKSFRREKISSSLSRSNCIQVLLIFIDERALKGSGLKRSLIIL